MNNLNEQTSRDFPREYRYSFKMKLFAGIGSPLLIVLFMWLAVWIFSDTNVERDLWVKLFLAAVSSGMIVLMVAAILEIFRSKLMLYPDRLHFIDVFRERTIAVSEIEGFRIIPNGQGVQLILKDKSKKKISIPSNLEHSKELSEWFEKNLKDLDAADFKSEEEEILANEELGITQEERRERLERMRTITKNAKWPIIGISLWVIIYPHPYELAVAIAAILPALGILMSVNSKGVLRLDEKFGSAYPSMDITIMPAIGLAIRALMDYNIVQYNDIWLPTGAVLVTIGGFIFWKSKEYHAKPFKFFGMLFFLGVYSYGLIIQGNCMLDKSEPITHPVHVIEKRIDKDKRTSWYLTVSPWGPRASQNEIEISRPTYEAVQVGDSVHVKEKSGLLGIHWFYTRPMMKNESAIR